MAEPANALVHVPPQADYLSPVMDVQTALKRLADFQEFVRSYLIYGQDYGKIPGTKQDTLLKSGADKLCEIYGLTPVYRQKSMEDWTKNPPLIKYTITCALLKKATAKIDDQGNITGAVVSTGIASANSWESKYKYRYYGGQRQVNHDIADQDNTLLKMAEKRALVAAVIGATRSSGIFTQDLEDLPREQIDTQKEKGRRGRPPRQEAAPARPVTPTGKFDPKELEEIITKISESPDGRSLVDYCNVIYKGLWTKIDEDSKTAIVNAKNARLAELDKAIRHVQPQEPEEVYGEPGVFDSEN